MNVNIHDFCDYVNDIANKISNYNRRLGFMKISEDINIDKIVQDYFNLKEISKSKNKEINIIAGNRFVK
jgi:hypothetical protein